MSSVSQNLAHFWQELAAMIELQGPYFYERRNPSTMSDPDLPAGYGIAVYSAQEAYAYRVIEEFWIEEFVDEAGRDRVFSDYGEAKAAIIEVAQMAA